MKKFKDTEYYVTEDGKVYSNKFNKWRERKPSVDKDGYLQLNLHINKKRKNYKIHRLVAEVYLSNPNNLLIIEHRDDIKTNNHVSNLMWSNVADNNKHANENGLIPKGEKHGRSKLTEEQVKYIRENYIPYDSQFGTRALGRKFSVSQRTICIIIKNKTWKHI
jgi:hypothetical protein